MRRIQGGIVALVAACACALAPPATALDAEQVRSRVVHALAQAGPATGLLRWGPDPEFLTRVVTADELEEDGTLGGDVWLVGGGDPTLTGAELAELAAD